MTRGTSTGPLVPESAARLVHQPGNPEYDVVDPRADAIAESLRAFGYSLADAIADLVDNSLAAGSKHIDITFWWDGPSSW
ncbi:MAG: hypothetical protein JRN35_10470, partial [Nitrososphaerota archaeon]|nr:hypothetical protein [Nitrososphaerota archaeon]